MTEQREKAAAEPPLDCLVGRNPNNCGTCDYMKLNGNREKGHCYMFRVAPTTTCAKHTSFSLYEKLAADWLRC